MIKNAPNSPGVISESECYTTIELRRRARLGDTVWRAVRRELDARNAIVRIGRKQYVLGRDWLEYLRSRKEDDTTT